MNDDLTALVLCILEVGWKTERYFLEANVVLVSTYRCNSKDCRKGRSRVSFMYSYKYKIICYLIGNYLIVFYTVAKYHLTIQKLTFLEEVEKYLLVNS